MLLSLRSAIEERLERMEVCEQFSREKESASEAPWWEASAASLPAPRLMDTQLAAVI